MPDLTDFPDADLLAAVEAVIFASDQPVSVDALLAVFADASAEEQSTKPESDARDEQAPSEIQSVTAEMLTPVFEALEEKYVGDEYPFEIRRVAGGYQFFSKPRFHAYIRRAGLIRNQKRLTRSALETLAIVAYRQPVTKSEVEFIRGVNCDYALHKLLEKQLIEILGRADAIGKPLLYGTSSYFMQYFGIDSVEDLPRLKEFEHLVEDHLEAFQQQNDDDTQPHERTQEAEEIEEVQKSQSPQRTAQSESTPAPQGEPPQPGEQEES